MANKMKGFPNPNRMNTIAPGIAPGVKPEDLSSVRCKCGVTRFIPICELKHASRFQTLVGQPMLVNFQGGYACMGCGQVNDFAPESVGGEKESGKPEDNGNKGNVKN